MKHDGLQLLTVQVRVCRLLQYYKYKGIDYSVVDAELVIWGGEGTVMLNDC